MCLSLEALSHCNIANVDFTFFFKQEVERIIMQGYYNYTKWQSLLLVGVPALL